MLRGFRNLSSWTRDWTWALSSESTEVLTSGPPGNFLFLPSNPFYLVSKESCMWGRVANIILRVLSAGRNLGSLAKDKEAGRAIWVEGQAEDNLWLNEFWKPTRSSGKENEASRSPGLWKLLAGWKPSYWWVWLISSASQKNAGKGITPGRDVMQQTRLISYKPVLFVCLWGGEKKNERKWCFWGTPHLLFLLQAG